MEDEKIIGLFFARSEQGIRELDAKYGKFCRRLAYNMLGDAQIDREIVAEFVETRLLTDEQVMREVVRREGKSFARRLLDTLRGLIEKVKAALHIGNADAEQLKMLERGRDILAEVIRSEETAEKTGVEASGGMQLLIARSDKNIPVLVIDADIAKNKTGQSDLIREVKDSISKIPYVAISKQRIYFTSDTKRETTFSKYSKWLKSKAADVFIDKMRAVYNLDELVLATTDYVNEGLKHPRKDNIVDFARGRVLMDILGKQYTADVVVGFTDKGICELHDVVNINPTQFGYKKTNDALSTISSEDEHLQKRTSFVNTTVSQNNSGVNSKYTQNSKKDADIDGFSVGGVNAKTADVGRLADAERMEKAGTDSETVRRETGWYRGYDGKWRFEIDDSKMRFINHREESRRTWKLDELIRHDALFAAYPELRNYTVLNFAFEDGINGVFSPGLNRIMLNPNLDRAGKRAALIHEIQHAIQVIEGFAAGSSTDYWQDAFVTDEEKRTERHLLELSRKNRLLEEDMYRLLEDTPDARRDALRATLVKRHGEKAVREFTDTYNHLLNLQKQREMRAEQAYRNTAGEIEAANVASRLSLSAKQRAETRPDIDRTNVRFSQSAGWHHAEYDPETAGIKEQLEHSAETLNAMRTVTSVEVPQNFTSKSEAAKWAIETLKRTGYQVERQGYGVIHFNENDIKYGAKYADTAAEKAAFAAIPAVLKRGIEIGGHANHKAREKQTVTFAAPVELNGIRGNMAVVVNKRGDHYYTHRIVLPDGRTFTFSEKNNATRELSRGVTVSGSLAETTSVASKNSISNSAENVNTILKKDAETDADIRFSVGGEQTDADADAEVSDADKRFAPVESAIRMLKGGADLWRTLRETGASPREIALRMATSGESDAAIRELTGLYRDALGVWTYDKAWFDAHVPDIADTRELRAGYKLGTVDEQLLGLAPEEVKASRRRLLDSAKLPDGMSKTQVAAAMADAQKNVALIFRPLRFALLASSAAGGMMFSLRSKRCCAPCAQTGLSLRAQKKKSKSTGLDFMVAEAGFEPTTFGL